MLAKARELACKSIQGAQKKYRRYRRVVETGVPMSEIGFSFDFQWRSQESSANCQDPVTALTESWKSLQLALLLYQSMGPPRMPWMKMKN